MIALTKLLGMLFMPMGLLWLGLLGAVVWAWRRRAWGLGLLLASIATVYTLAGNLQVGHALLARLEATVPPLPADAAPLEALYVLGGGTQVDERGRPFLRESGDRILEAARLWRAGRVKRLVAGGTSSDARTGLRRLGSEARAIWMELGIPSEAILVIEEPCFITRDELRAFCRLKAREGWSRVGLLSSAWHLPRAMALARREGLEVTPLTSDRRGRVPRFELWDVVPQPGGFQNSQHACWELAGRWAGR